ncbi:MAG: hypothetical protein ABSA78_18505 [Candidatus Sulfotelmatobacter sp.]
MAIAMPEVKGHPNRVQFRGVLTVIDMPSERAPSGAKGHLVVLTRHAAQAALPSLMGMALDYSPTLDRHDVRRKVGVITRAEVVGRNVELGGHLFARDFPEIVEEIAKSGRGDGMSLRDRLAQEKVAHARAEDMGAAPAWIQDGLVEPRSWKESLSSAMERLRSLTAVIGEDPPNGLGPQGGFHAATGGAAGGVGAGLGMSYEVTGVELVDPRARVWTLTKVIFTGAAILRRDKAAYQNTWIELST